MSVHIAIDIGGTQLRAAAYFPTSQTPVRLERTPTRGPGAPLERLKDLVASIWPSGEKVLGIGVAAPGPTDPYRGVVLSAPNIPGWTNLPLRQELEQRFQTPVALGNDANLAALGEWKFGAGQGHHDVFYLTVSTGIGGGVIINDRLLLGSTGLAGELGHVRIMQDGPLCGCGQRGHLEAVASGTAIARWVQEQIGSGAATSLPADQAISARQISDAAEAGDALAIQALERAGTFMGQGLANYLHIFNPSMIIMGGGVSHSGAHFFNALRATLRAEALNEAYLAGLEIVPAALGDEAGLMGALALARDLVREPGCEPG